MAGSYRVAVVGASGYGGAEIVRLLSSHPCATVTVATSGRSAGRALRDECPWLSTDLTLTAFEPEKVDVDVVFLCQEAGFAMEHAANLVGHAKVIDLSADFRLKDHGVFERTYGRPHTNPDLGGEPEYGLPELVDRERIAASPLIANPGCYPTATLLAIMPLIRAGLAQGTPVVDAKSGVSGAGRSKKETDYLFSELSGGFKPYAVTGHRHNPEIEQLAGRPVRFTPHLIPAARGLEATCHVQVGDSSRDALRELFRESYRSEPFVSVRDTPPSTKQVLGSNRCDIFVDYDARTGFAVVCSVIDNLVKGAAGQAIQNMNLMLGLPEDTGLPKDGIWP
ncbi:N-acetyl-gamma-glutamyl-phosphate reductase [Fimbriimonas ginsengisoli]|uniref:N-acetyl-gamma-glutamyl-phosphate reductase n=1 Tax=Fimbriimonas ginsengisoli Gsoil 348 TaxID=661478 RepID=A0A068NPK7_FIMGI|nr:N-acetyl-gamma-glutamyl-phosphate reductase [Fimbriimonas ginsengisoli]AIE85483.1 N-acetyl-gamma-glutamyl-phosphate reductase [Fimbriimonas ginsengisoli Gsoil 348]